jgi:hypothetical protein
LGKIEIIDNKKILDYLFTIIQYNRYLNFLVDYYALKLNKDRVIELDQLNKEKYEYNEFIFYVYKYVQPINPSHIKFFIQTGKEINIYEINFNIELETFYIINNNNVSKDHFFLKIRSDPELKFIINTLKFTNKY